MVVIHLYNLFSYDDIQYSEFAPSNKQEAHIEDIKKPVKDIGNKKNKSNFVRLSLTYPWAVPGPFIKFSDLSWSKSVLRVQKCFKELKKKCS